MNISIEILNNKLDINFCRPKKTMSDNAPIIVRYSSSKPVDKCDSLSTLRHSIECIRQIPNDNSKPFLRACGCAHRFSPTSTNGFLINLK